MKELLTSLTAILVILSAAGLSNAVTVQLTTSVDISGASEDATGNYYVAEGGTFDVELNVLNPSDSGDTATNIEATLSLPSGLSTSDSLTKTVSSSLSQGSDADTSWTVTGDVAGNYLGQIEITTQGSNTAQNDDSTGVLVKSPASIVGGISCSATDSKVVKSGFNVVVNVQNLGDLDATDISINLSSSPSDISFSNPQTISSIEGGSSGSSTYSSLSTTQATTYTFTATVSSANAGSDTGTCTAETVASLPNDYICSGNSDCDSGCCSSSLCVASAACSTSPGGDTGGGGGGGGGYTLVPSDKNSTKRPTLVPGVGLRNNTKLQAALEKVLAKGQLSEQARENMLRLSESITSEIQVQRNFKSSNGTSSMENRYQYKGQNRVRNLAIYDNIPKEFAQSSDNITVTAQGASIEVVEIDPEYIFLYDSVNADQEIVITYTVGASVSETVIDSFGTEIYAESIEEGTASSGSQICTPGDRMCSGNDLQECNAQGSAFVTVQPCEFGCVNSVCQSAPAVVNNMMFLIIVIILVVAAIAGAAFYVMKNKKSGGGKVPSMSSTKIGKF